MMDQRNPTMNAMPPRGKRQQFTAQIDLGRSLGRQMLDRVMPTDFFDTTDKFDKILRQTLKRNRGTGDFHMPTSGVAAAFRDFLLDPEHRKRLFEIAPAFWRSG